MKLNKKISIWFTGYPASGKTTLAKKFKRELDKIEIPSIIFDGDQIRKLIFNNKSYDKKSRIKSALSYLKLAKIVLKAKLVLIVSTNHHTNKQRKLIKKNLKNDYLEIWVKTPLKVCMKRDPKMLYSKFKKGKIKNLVGGDLKFEKPTNSDLVIQTLKDKIPGQKKILSLLLKKKIIINEK
tara:strand:- start:1008 stop:1550 length:543 start_codon:yes stop_codon:yes gene_type:complete